MLKRLGFSLVTGMVTVLVAVQSAHAQTTTTATPSSQPNSFLLNLPIIAAVMALFYFGILRPQNQQQKKLAEVNSKLNRGDEVVTNSGIIGRIVGMNDRVVTLEVSPQTEIKILRSQVQGLFKDLMAAEAVPQKS